MALLGLPPAIGAGSHAGMVAHGMGHGMAGTMHGLGHMGGEEDGGEEEDGAEEEDSASRAPGAGLEVLAGMEPVDQADIEAASGEREIGESGVRRRALAHSERWGSVYIGEVG